MPTKIFSEELRSFQALYRGYPKLVIWLTFVGVSLLFYAPEFQNRDLVMFDDLMLVMRVKNVNSLSDYVALWRQGRVIDRQPLRDLSYIVDWKLSKALKIWTFKITQWVVWMLCLGILLKLLDFFWVKRFWMWMAVFWVGLHPVTPILVAWLGGRKHLLSCFFVLLASWIWLLNLRTEKKFLKWAAVGAWVCSLLCQPISLLWPAWAFLVDHRSRRSLTLLSVFAILTGIFAWWNWSYYQSDEFMRFFGQSKVVSESWNTVFYRFVIWGRAVLHVIVPFFPNFWPWDLSDPWFEGLGFVSGLVVAKTTFFLAQRLWKDPKSNLVSSFWIFSFLPILTVTLRMTGQSGYDPYLACGIFASGIGLGVYGESWARRLKETLQQAAPNWSDFKNSSNRGQLYLVSLAHRWLNTPRKFLLIFMGAFVVWFLCFSTWLQVQGWNNGITMTERMLEIRRRPIPLVNYARLISLPKKDMEEARKLSAEAYSQDPKEIYLGYVLGSAITGDSNLTDNQKTQLLNTYDPPSAWYHLLRAQFFLEKDESEFKKSLQRLESLNPRRIEYEMDSELSTFKRFVCGLPNPSSKLCH